MTVYINGVAVGAAAGGGDAVITVAADNTPAAQKDRADFVCPGANDEVTIQALIAAGVTVKLMVGDYIFNDTLDILVSNFRLEGSGMGTVISGILAVPYIAIGDSASYIENVTIRDLRIDGAAQTNSYGIHCDGGSFPNRLEHIQILNCRFDNTDDDGIRCEWLYNSLIDGNYLETVGSSAAIYIGQGGALNVISNNLIFNAIGGGIFISTLIDSVIEGNVIEEASVVGIRIDSAHNTTISGNSIIESDDEGILVTGSTWCTITGNTIENSADEGIRLASTSNNNTITGNNVRSNTGGGIELDASLFNTITGNNCEANGVDGIRLANSSHDNVVTGNNCKSNSQKGITLHNSDRNTVTGNNVIANSTGIQFDGAQDSVITGNTISQNTQHGITFITSPCCCVISGNTFIENNRHGLNLAGNDNNITGNVFFSNSQQTDVTYSNIFINGDHNLIEANVCRMGVLANQPAYGIEIGGGTGNMVLDNDLYESGLTGPISDGGTDTEFNNITFQFIQGATFVSSTGSAKGWEINLAAEWAIALGQLPLELLQVVRIKIWAVGLAAPGATNAMMLEININAGQDDEPYATEAIAIPNKPSSTDDTAIGDIIHWILTVADGADIADLIGGDSIEVEVLHEATGGGDIETDAVLRAVEIEYVT